MRADRVWTLVRDVLAVLLPVVAAILLAYQLSDHDQRNRVEIIAGVVLHRTAMTTDQLASVFDRMSVFGPDQACSPRAKALMSQIDLGSSLLQGVGYIEDNELKCSSLGQIVPTAVGPVDYVSATNTSFRRQRALDLAPGTPLLLITASSGYTGLVHPALIFSLTDTGNDVPTGVVSFSTRQMIIASDDRQFDWRKADIPADQFSGTLVMDDQLIAWQRSPKWDHFTYAAIPLSAVTDEFVTLGGLFIPIGAVVGLAALLLIRRFAAHRTSLPALLRAGLARNEIFPVYQPIVDMRTGRWVGAEVLARWQRPGGEWVAPDVFVPIAEKHGLIRQLTRHVMLSSADDLHAFVQMEPAFFVSVNIASTDLQDPDFARELVTECDARGIAHHLVHLEITERAEVDPEREAQSIRLLREQGFEVGIDDFGIGYSNLAYLDTLNVDYLKIDKVFVAGMAGDGIGATVIDHIIDLANVRGLKIVAEGVEKAQQRADLVSRGVWLGQGWLFGKPMPRADLLAAYAANRLAADRAPRLAQVA